MKTRVKRTAMTFEFLGLQANDARRITYIFHDSLLKHNTIHYHVTYFLLFFLKINNRKPYSYIMQRKEVIPVLPLKWTRDNQIYKISTQHGISFCFDTLRCNIKNPLTELLSVQRMNMKEQLSKWSLIKSIAIVTDKTNT